MYAHHLKLVTAGFGTSIKAASAIVIVKKFVKFFMLTIICVDQTFGHTVET